jgi:hypothetical protein
MTTGRTTVIVVGAGASLAQAQSALFLPRSKERFPPLDNTFLDKSNEIKALRKYRAAVINSIARTGFANPWSLAGSSMEQFFADVYYEVAALRRRDSRTEMYTRLLRLYHRTLSATTNWMMRVREHGVFELLIEDEMRRGKSVTVVTFNQDLVLESAAAKLRPASQWCLASLYRSGSFLPGVLLNNPNAPLFRHHGPGCPHDPPFTLLKLHGSLNWVLVSRGVDPTMGTLFPGTRPRRIYCLNTRFVPENAVLRGKRLWQLWPLVVPPIYDKPRVVAMKMFQRLWADARTALEEANRVVFFGYSLPDADISAKELFRRSIAGNNSLRAVDCINPDPELVPKLKRLFDVPVIHYYSDVYAYLSAARTA